MSYIEAEALSERLIVRAEEESKFLLEVPEADRSADAEDLVDAAMWAVQAYLGALPGEHKYEVTPIFGGACVVVRVM